MGEGTESALARFTVHPPHRERHRRRHPQSFDRPLSTSVGSGDSLRRTVPRVSEVAFSQVSSDHRMSRAGPTENPTVLCSASSEWRLARTVRVPHPRGAETRTRLVRRLLFDEGGSDGFEILAEPRASAEVGAHTFEPGPGVQLNPLDVYTACTSSGTRASRTNVSSDQIVDRSGKARRVGVGLTQVMPRRGCTVARKGKELPKWVEWGSGTRSQRSRRAERYAWVALHRRLPSHRSRPPPRAQPAQRVPRTRRYAGRQRRPHGSQRRLASRSLIRA